MDLEGIFSVANTTALAGWVALIALPRWRQLLTGLRYVVPAVLSAAYTVLFLLFFFKVEGGGFGSLAQVKALLSSDPVLLGGWIHYLAFDLFVGTHIAEQSDRRGIHRLIQAPLLFVTFMAGPVGFLIAAVSLAMIRPATREA
jgi:hypothetical protein